MRDKKAHKLRIYTGQEHETMGSTPLNPRALEKPFTPEALVDGTDDVEAVNKAREGQEIDAIAAGQYFGLEGPNVPVIKLSRIDPKTGEVEDRMPRLVGIKNLLNGEITRDPKVLEVHSLTEEGRRKLFIESPIMISSSEQKG